MTQEPINLKEMLRSLERDTIRNTLKATQGNKTKAAALLMMNRSTLVEKLRHLGMLDLINARPRKEND